MASEAYIQGRKRYGRPQALLFSNTPGTVSNGHYVPDGVEMSLSIGEGIDYDFMVLSDHNRGLLSVSYDRIEQRKRMINGRTRSIHIADKVKISTSWTMIPSRAFASAAAAEAFYADTGEEDLDAVDAAARYTVDGGAGGADMLRWYQDHPGTFWALLAYDNPHNFQADAGGPWDKLGRYNERVEVFISDFKYSVEKRGANFDYWNVDLSIEEA